MSVRGSYRMESLNTVVQDIYARLEGLSNGEALEINEEELDQTMLRMKESILAWSKPRESSKKFTLRMSNVGRPLRQLWYDNKNVSEPSVISAPTQIKFLYGHILEEIVLMLVRLSGHEVSSEQKEISVAGIKGHMDCKIDGEVVDIKTASGYAFRKFKEGT